LFAGLYRDDIVSEEYPVVKEALKRLSEKELFDRTFRLRRAIQLNLNHDVLPPSQHTKPDQVPAPLHHPLAHLSLGRALFVEARGSDC